MGLSNNDTFKKLRVAHKLRDDEIVKICAKSISLLVKVSLALCLEMKIMKNICLAETNFYVIFWMD